MHILNTKKNIKLKLILLYIRIIWISIRECHDKGHWSNQNAKGDKKIKMAIGKWGWQNVNVIEMPLNGVW
jgi:hypothetical protein